MMPYTRIGLAFRPPGTGWQCTHAQNPFPQFLDSGNVRIHFATRDEKNRSQGAWVELSNLDHPTVVSKSEFPSIWLGNLGCFDDAGAMPHSIVEESDHIKLYYTGWSLGRTVPFTFYIGLAISMDGGRTFDRVHQAPIIGRTSTDPFMVGAPWVMKDNGHYRMWYISCTGWELDPEGDSPKHYYTVKHAASSDGINWTLTDKLCLPYLDREYAIARPVVLRVHDGYLMHFSYRADGTTYRLGWARSDDGLDWTRCPPLDFEQGATGQWDSEMICYACPLTHRGNEYLLYNGNSYGRDGFGIAKVADSSFEGR